MDRTTGWGRTTCPAKVDSSSRTVDIPARNARVPSIRARKAPSTRPGSGLAAALGRLLRSRRSVHRRQRLEILRDACAILGTQLRGVLDHARHRAAGVVAIWHLAGFEKI